MFSLPAMELACNPRAAFAPRIVIRRLSILLTALLCSSFAWAQESNLPELSASNTDTDTRNGDQVFTGNARFIYQGILLTADEIRYNPSLQTATARGQVVLTIDSNLTVISSQGRALVPHGAKRLLAEEIVLHLRDRTFSGRRLRMGEHPLFVEAGQFEGGPRNITLSQARLFYREPSAYAPSLTAARLSIVNRDRIVAENARLGTGSTPALPFHRISQNVNDPLISHMSAKVGHSGSLGYFAELGLQLPVSTGVQMGGDLGLYTSRGILFGPSGSYHLDHRNTRIATGEFSTGYIHDNGDKSTDILGRPIHSDRAFVDWKETSRFGETTSITRLNYWTDSAVARDFRADSFYGDQQPDSFHESLRTTDNLVGSAFLRVQPNTFHRTQQRLPELRLDQLPAHVSGGIYSRGHISFASLRERQFTVNTVDGEDTLQWITAPTATSNRIDCLYALERPFKPKDWFVFTPVAAGRLTHYFDAVNGRNTYSRGLGEIGADASLRASGIYDYKNERWGIDGIRHLVTPKISYRYIPAADKGKRYIPQIDDRVFDTALPSLELADQRNIDDLDAANVVRIGLDNTFQTRDASYGSRDLLTLNLAGDYRFHRNPGEKDVSAIHTGVSLTPVRWFRFDVYNSFTPQDTTLRELNTRLTLLNGQLWSFSLATHYLQHQIEEYITESRYRLNEVYSTVVRMHYDTRRRRFNELSLSLHQNLNNVWSIQYGIRRFDGRQREGSVGFNIGARLIGL